MPENDQFHIENINLNNNNNNDDLNVVSDNLRLLLNAKKKIENICVHNNNNNDNDDEHDDQLKSKKEENSNMSDNNHNQNNDNNIKKMSYKNEILLNIVNNSDNDNDHNNCIINGHINNNSNNNNVNDDHTLRFITLPTRQLHEKFLRDCFEEIINLAVFNATDRKNKVIEWQNPDKLSKIIDLNLKSKSDNDDKLIELIRDIIKYSVKTGHPYFVNQLFSSIDPYALAGQWLTDALNPSIYTYEVSPVFTLMEDIVLKQMRTIIGYPSIHDNDNNENNNNGDGIFCPGGSIANGMAISCARYKAFPDAKKIGLSSLPRLIIFTSEDAHYSIEKLASFMGIGSNNVYKIKTDSRGKMNVDHLIEEIERAISEGAYPLMVSATSGTTVFGAFDPLESIHKICKKYNIWLHVDAAWGGGALMSKKYRKLLKGIERSDSVTWNPHKLLAAPQQCSTFLTKHTGILSAVHSTNAVYLFQKDKFYDTKYDIGDKHIQCGRRVDVLKFWLMWRAKGTDGFESHINHVFDMAEYFTQKIKKNHHFQLVLDNPECTNVCFWYIPKSLLNNLSKNTEEFKQKLHMIAPKIKERMMKKGSMMITYQPSKIHPNFFRLVIQNSGLNTSDMNFIIDEIDRLGNDL